MTTEEYEQKKQECWDALHKELLDGEVQWQPVSRKEIVNFAFDRAYAFGKQEKDADTVIQGWVGMDMSGSLYVYCHEPERNLMKCLWEGEIMSISLSDDMFPDLTWDSDPEEVEIMIKRKKNAI